MANQAPPTHVWPAAANAWAHVLYVAPVVNTSSTNTTLLGDEVELPT
jgi:hypothetical protein